MTVDSAAPNLTTLLNKLDVAATADEVRFAVEDISAAKLVLAVPTLIEVLGYNNPGAAVAAVDGLIAIGEPAVMPLMELLDGFNYGARAWALRALAVIGDPRGIDLLAKAAVEDFALSVRRAAARGVGKLHWQDFPQAERARAQLKALETLLKVCDDPEWVVRYSAVTGLEALGLNLEVEIEEKREQLVWKLKDIISQDESIALQARAKLALDRIVDG